MLDQGLPFYKIQPQNKTIRNFNLIFIHNYSNIRIIFHHNLLNNIDSFNKGL